MEDSLPGCLGWQASSLPCLNNRRIGRLEACQPRQARCLSSVCPRRSSSISIEFRSLLRVSPQKITGSILLVSWHKAFHFADHLFYPKVFREAQWPAAPDRKAGAENHPVIGI